jgi:hypothetical protein
MKLSERQRKLLELTPANVVGDWQEIAGRTDDEDGEFAQEVQRELNYLRLVSSRKVALPDDAHFAGLRLRIEQRVHVHPVSIWQRLFATIWPENIRPVPGVLAVGMLAVAILTLMMYYPSMIRNNGTAAYGPFVSIGETYDLQVAANENGQLTQQELKEYREILVMSTAILGSPSSLSRSRALSTGGK